MRLFAAAPELVASEDHAWIAWLGDRLTLLDSDTRRILATTALPATAQLAFLGPRLLLLVPEGAGTQLVVLAVPTLETVAQARLDGRFELLAVTGSRALVAHESREQPRIVGVAGNRLLVEPIAMREPLLMATAAPEERLLVAARARETLLECWDPLARRALFRLNLPLMPRPGQAGFAARRRLLWIASADGDGQLEVFRFSDGRQQARLQLGARVLGAVGHPESPRLILALRQHEGAAAELIELDFGRVERRELAVPGTVQAMCVVERGTPALVVLTEEAREPAWIPLPALLAEAPAAPAQADAPAAPAQKVHRVQTVTTTTASAAASAWRTKLGGRAAPTPSPAAAAPTATAAPANVIDEPASRGDTDEAHGAAAGLHWRDQLCDWAAAVLAHPRQRRSLPAIDKSRLGDAAERLRLPPSSQRALALLYGARLLGHPDLPAVTVARGVADGAAPDELAWSEALGRGPLAERRLVRRRRGRLALRPLATRFLDGADPAVTVLPGDDGAPGDRPMLRLRLDGESLEVVGRRLVREHGHRVALITLDDAAPRRALADGLAEARLYDAWPLVEERGEAAAWLPALDGGPVLIAVRGEPPELLAHLPEL